MHAKSRTPLVVVSVLFAVAGIVYWGVVTVLTGGLQLFVTLFSLDSTPEKVDLGWPNRWLIVGITFAIGLAVQFVPVRPAEQPPAPGALPPPPFLHAPPAPETQSPAPPSPTVDRPTTIADLPPEPPTYREF